MNTDRPAPKFRVMAGNYGQSIDVDCDLCGATHEWLDGMPDLADMSKWAAEHRREHVQAWEAQQREAGQVFYARYWRHHNDYNDEFFSAEEAAHFLMHGSENSDLSSVGVVFPDGSVKDYDRVLGSTAEPA